MASKRTIDAYNRYARTYDAEVIDFWAAFPQTIIDHFVAALPGKTVLDVGSGSGRDAMVLQRQGLEVVCVDASQAMIDMTRQLGFESHLMDFGAMHFAKASFAGVWAYTSLIHLPTEEMIPVIRKLHTILHPQGVLLFGAIEGSGERMIERQSMA